MKWIVSVTEADLGFTGLPWRFLLWENTQEVTEPSQSLLEARRGKGRIGCECLLLGNLWKGGGVLGSGQPHEASVYRDREKQGLEVGRTEWYWETKGKKAKGRSVVASVVTVLLCPGLSSVVLVSSPTRKVATALNKIVPPSTCSEIPTYFLNSKHADPCGKASQLFLGILE